MRIEEVSEPTRSYTCIEQTSVGNKTDQHRQDFYSETIQGSGCEDIQEIVDFSPERMAKTNKPRQNDYVSSRSVYES